MLTSDVINGHSRDTARFEHSCVRVDLHSKEHPVAADVLVPFGGHVGMPPMTRELTIRSLEEQVALRLGRNDGLIWPHCDGLKWPHLGRNRRRRDVLLVKPDPPLEAADVTDLEVHAQFSLAGAPVTLRGSAVRLCLPGLYWALGRMVRAALTDQPDRCERRAEEFIKALPMPRTSK